MVLLQEFKKDIDGVMVLIEKGDQIRARICFNYDVELKYEKKIKYSKSILYIFLSFFLELDEYFNNDKHHLLKENLSRQDITDRYHGEYLQELRDLEEKHSVSEN